MLKILLIWEGLGRASLKKKLWHLSQLDGEVKELKKHLSDMMMVGWLSGPGI